MLSRLVGFSTRFRGVVLALACITILYGIYTTRHAKFDIYPEFAPPEVIVQTEAPGLAPEEVETLVTRPVEYALNGTPNLTSIRSQSIQGLSVVTVIFSDRTDVYRARQMVNERLASATTQMPQGVQPPTMAPLVGATSLTLIIGLTSDTQSAMDLRTFADWTVRPRLLAVPGVARVANFGGGVKELQIQLLPDRLAALHVSESEVVSAARTASAVRGAGFVETDSQRIVLNTRGKSISFAELGQAVLSTANGQTLRLQDVAHVVDAPTPAIGGATIMGKPGVMVEVSDQYGANTLEVTRNIEKALDELKPAIAAAHISLYPDLFRPANFINASIHNISIALFIGGILVALVLFVFLFNIRVAAISLTAIPISLLIAVLVLDWFGQSLNTLTLGGLAIAIGEVVDDAIIDAENIYRRLREAPKPVSWSRLLQIVREASLEIRSAVVYATFVVAMVFLPVLTMSGIQGRLFAPLGWAYIIAILASLLVALTVTPALCCVLLRNVDEHASEPAYIHKLKAAYQRFLHGLATHTNLLMTGAALLCVLALAAIPFLGGEFLPEMREGHYILHAMTLPGTSLRESERLGRLVSDLLLKDKDVRLVSQQIGRAEEADDTWGVHYSEFHINLKPSAEADPDQVKDRLRETVANIPGLSVSINSFLIERMEEIISGNTGDVSVHIYGDDLDALDRGANQAASVLGTVRGAADIQIESPPGTPQLDIRAHSAKLLQFGFQPVNVLDAIETAYQGSIAGQVYDENRVFNISVIFDKNARQNPDLVGSLLLQNGEGTQVPLRQLADISETAGRYAISHDGTRRRQTITCNVTGRDVASFVNEAERTLRAKVPVPAGSYITVGGISDARAQARREIIVHSLIAGAGVVILLSIVFNNTRNLLLVLVNVPFALVGGVFAAFFTGGTLSIGSMVGFVTLFGITMRNSIMIVSHFEHLVTKEGENWGPHAVFRGATERLTPVLMTAIVTALGLLPLALGSGKAGREIEGPMATVILGGLITSTALNLLVLPALALRFGRFSAAERET
jgi:CzcA family heavy metal efflux pump